MARRFKVGKYGNQRTNYNGRSYQSKAEARYAKKLDILKGGGQIRDWRPQVPVPLVVNSMLIAKYIVDFAIINNDGTRELIEIKGMETAVWKLKYKLFKALYPDLKITVIYADNKKKRRGSSLEEKN